MGDELRGSRQAVEEVVREAVRRCASVSSEGAGAEELLIESVQEAADQIIEAVWARPPEWHRSHARLAVLVLLAEAVKLGRARLRRAVNQQDE